MASIVSYEDAADLVASGSIQEKLNLNGADLYRIHLDGGELYVLVNAAGESAVIPPYGTR